MRQRKRTRPTARVLSALLVAVPLALGACTAADVEDTASLTQPPVLVSPFPEVTASALRDPAAAKPSPENQNVLAPVYWIGRTGGNAYLFREDLPVSRGDNAISAAVQAIMGHQPPDKDYFSPWQSAERVGASMSENNTITLDISHDAFNSSLDASMASRAVQQLVYTAIAAANDAGMTDGITVPAVVILVDGRPGYVAFGHVSLGERMTRDLSLLSPVWITAPTENQKLAAGTSQLTGVVLGDQVNASWELQKQDANGAFQHLSSGSAGLRHSSVGVGEFSIPARLLPGTYIFTVRPGRQTETAQLPSDTKTFSVG